MRLSPTPDPVEIEFEAARWLIRLDAVPSPQERAEFARWLEADTRREAVYLRLASAWQIADRLRELRPWDGSLDQQVLERFPAAR